MKPAFCKLHCAPMPPVSVVPGVGSQSSTACVISACPSAALGFGKERLPAGGWWSREATTVELNEKSSGFSSTSSQL